MNNEYRPEQPAAPQPTHPARPNGFAVASMVLSILAFLSVFTMTIVPPIILGGLSVILGLLSRGDKKPGSYALTGIIVSASALVIDLALCATAFYMVFSNPELTREYRQLMDETYEQMTGMDLDELLEHYGISEGMPQQ